MEQIFDFTALKPGDKFHRIAGGNISHFIFGAVHPKIEDGILAINDASYVDARVFTKQDFSYGVFYIGYDSKIAGAKIVEQLNDRIKSIEKTYGKNPPF